MAQSHLAGWLAAWLRGCAQAPHVVSSQVQLRPFRLLAMSPALVNTAKSLLSSQSCSQGVPPDCCLHLPGCYHYLSLSLRNLLLVTLRHGVDDGRFVCALPCLFHCFNYDCHCFLSRGNTVLSTATPVAC